MRLESEKNLKKTSDEEKNAFYLQKRLKHPKDTVLLHPTSVSSDLIDRMLT